MVSTKPRAIELEYFDRETILKNKISAIHIKVFENKRGEDPKDWGIPCPVYIYKFDDRGNIIEGGLARLGSKHGYQYDDNNKLKSWSWEDKSTGEIKIFTESDFEQGVYNKELAERESELKKMILTKINYREPHEKEIIDTCANIDAIYSIKLINEKHGLPVYFKAIKNAELKTFPDNKLKSPDVLYLWYEYVRLSQ
jgi:hypothetical protein